MFDHRFAVCDQLRQHLSWYDPFVGPSPVTGLEFFKKPSESRIRRKVDRSTTRLSAFLGDSAAFDGPTFCRFTETGDLHAIFPEVRLGDNRYFVSSCGLRDWMGGVNAFGHIRLVLGSCLFSTRALTVETTHGPAASALLQAGGKLTGTVTRIAADDDLTLYEMENAVRLTRFVTDLMHMLPRSARISCLLQVPRVEYYLYLLEAWNRGQVDRETMLEWFRLVDVRHQKVCSLIRQLAEFDVDIMRGMSGTESIIRAAVHSGTPIAIDALVRAMGDRHPVWRHAAPKDPRQLVALSYAADLLDASDDALAIAVDNCKERRLLSQAVRLPRSRPSLIGLYPMERVFTTGHDGASHPYLHDPGPEVVDDLGRPYSPIDIVHAVYPSTRTGDVHASPLAQT